MVFSFRNNPRRLQVPTFSKRYITETACTDKNQEVIEASVLEDFGSAPNSAPLAMVNSAQRTQSCENS